MMELNESTVWCSKCYGDHYTIDCPGLSPRAARPQWLEDHADNINENAHDDYTESKIDERRIEGRNHGDI